LQQWFGKTPSSESKQRRNQDEGAAATPGQIAKPRGQIRIGIPRTLNQWSTHRFWIAFFDALGITKIDFSSDTSEAQMRDFGKGRGTVDCCYPVKSMSGHYGEFLARKSHRRVDILFSPMIYSLPSYLQGHVLENLVCPRVMAGPENIKAGFFKEKDVFAEHGIRYVTPLVALADRPIVPKQLWEGLQDVLPGLTRQEINAAVAAGYRELDGFNASMRQKSREVLEDCMRENKPCILVVGRPYHMDPGIGHEIEVDIQAYGYPVLWSQYLPTDPELINWLFKDDVDAGYINHPLDIGEVWPSSYSANTNEIIWASKFAARMPSIACVVRLASYECGMDQPTYSTVQQIVERSGTLFFAFQDLDSTKPAGSVKIRVETIAHYLGKYAADIMQKKREALPGEMPKGS